MQSLRLPASPRKIIPFLPASRTPVRPRSILRIALAALAVSLFAAPVAAQNDFVYAEIPWGSDAQSTTDALAAQGFVLNTEFTPDPGDLMYEDDDDVIALASFAGDALVGIRIVYSSTQEQIEEVIERSVEEAIRNLGEPEESGDDSFTWRHGQTTFSIIAGQSDSGVPYITVEYGGPGYEDEIARRIAASAQPLPELDARWTVLDEDEERRMAFDRTTMRRAEGRVLRVWVRTDYTMPQPDEAGEYDRSVNQIEYDCDDRRFRLVSASTRLGDQVVNSETITTEWVAIVPETIGENVLATVCEAGY